MKTAKQIYREHRLKIQQADLDNDKSDSVNYNKKVAEWVIEAMEEYHNQFSEKQERICKDCNKFILDSVEFAGIGKCKANTTYDYSKKDTDICDCNQFKRKKQ
jgi:hypothetical protein